MKVAIVHDWLTGMRGGERCLEAFCELFPEAAIFTLLHRQGAVSPTIERHPIRTSFLQRMPLSLSHYRYYLPLFPYAIRSFDLTGFDLILSSSHCVAKGIRVPPGTCHVSYVYTPMRYVWDQYESYFEGQRTGWATAIAMKLLRKSLRNWDVASSDGVHYFIAISRYVEERIRRHYGRGAEVIYPPVDFDAFSAVRGHDDFYLMVTAFAPYKRVDLAVEAFNTLKKPLKIVGTGQDERKVRALAGPTVELLGWRPDGDVRNYYARCKALIFPGEEDFGIVPLEAMASGKPVIAYGKGGALETVMPLNPLGHAQAASPAPTGVFFYEPTVQSLIEAVRLFETHAEDFDPTAIRAHVAPFDKTCFKQKIHEAIMRSYGHFHPSNLC